jgi:hypothetical protein
MTIPYKDYIPSTTWWLTKVDEATFREIYHDTEVMDIVELFRVPPRDDDDYFANYFPSRLFRMCSGLYDIEDKQGNKVGFEFNWAQHMVYSHYLKHPRLIILKSRQQGISTMWLMMFIDSAITTPNKSFGLMSQGKKESQTLFTRITTALKGLPSNVVELLDISVVKNNSEQISFSNESFMYIATSFRSGTLQGLHISEMGKISAKFPEKARETKAGSMQAIGQGLPVIVESTAEGRKNEFYSMWYTAVGYKGALTTFDFQPVFLSWVDDPDCSIEVTQVVTLEADEYFVKVEFELTNRRGKQFRLTHSQKNWWIAKKREIDSDKDAGDMSQEYPAYADEAFESVRDGSYYARHYRTHVKDMGREVSDLYDKKLPVFAACDLGRNDMWVTIYFQIFKNLDGATEFRIIGEYHNFGEDIEHYVNASLELPYTIRTWFLPHDASVKDLSVKKTRAGMFRQYVKSGTKVRILKVTTSRNNDITIVRDAMKNMWFDAEHANYIIEACYNYSKKWDAINGTWSETHLHDVWSNPADALRYVVMAFKGKIKSADDEITSGRKHGGSKKRRRGGNVAV